MSFRPLFVRTTLVLIAALATTPTFAQETADTAAPAATPAATQPAAAADASSHAQAGTPADAAKTQAAVPADTAATTQTPAAPGTAQPAQVVAFGDAKAGEAKAAVCGACHGVDGNPTDKQYPKLAGQNEAYVARQLHLFKTMKRNNPIMLGFASTLSEQDMQDVGAYFASKSALPGVADDKLLDAGQALYRGGDLKLGVPACMACHGPDGRGMAGTGFPQLAGQWTDYVSAKLNEWKSGTTWGDDPMAKIMPAIAHGLSEADINAVASYVEGLHTAGTPTATR